MTQRRRRGLPHAGASFRTPRRAAFARAREIGLLDREALRAARARVEWRPSLATVDELIDEFCR